MAKRMVWLAGSYPAWLDGGLLDRSNQGTALMEATNRGPGGLHHAWVTRIYLRI